jgi:hypothetical protein
MTVQECHAAMREELDKFEAMLTNPAYFEHTRPGRRRHHDAARELLPGRASGGEVGKVGTVEVHVS